MYNVHCTQARVVPSYICTLVQPLYIFNLRIISYPQVSLYDIFSMWWFSSLVFLSHSARPLASPKPQRSSMPSRLLKPQRLAVYKQICLLLKCLLKIENQPKLLNETKENRKYIRGEFRESLGMIFVSPFQTEREFKVHKSCKCSQIICSRVH